MADAAASPFGSWAASDPPDDQSASARQMVKRAEATGTRRDKRKAGERIMRTVSRRGECDQSNVRRVAIISGCDDAVIRQGAEQSASRRRRLDLLAREMKI